MTRTLTQARSAPSGRLGVLLAVPMMAVAGAAGAEDFSGNYPITVMTTHPAASVDRYCLTLVDDKSVRGARHGGAASIAGFVKGQFVVDKGALVAMVGVEDIHFTISAPIGAGHAGNSAFVVIDDHALAAAGSVTAGEKGGCTPFA